MLVVISDLHFEEVKRDAVEPPGAPHPVVFEERNLSPRAFEVLFHDLSAAARQDRAEHLDFVLAGDIFDLHRTTMWLDDALRPYVACADVGEGSPLEQKVLGILDAIADEKPVAQSLAAIRCLSSGGPRPSDAPALDIPALPIRVNYLPGNHDRLANATPAIRARVRSLLGLPASAEPFPHVHDSTDPRVLVRHGHEYDPLNFGGVLPSGAPIPVHLPERYYDEWTFGDFITVEVAMGLPRAFREVHGDAAIAADGLKATVYKRLLQFDDVRPQSQLVPFLLTIPDCDVKLVWKALEPAVRKLLDRIADSPHLPEALVKGRVSATWRSLLDMRLWRAGLPLWLVQKLGAMAAGAGGDPTKAAGREEEIEAGRRRFIIAGHTHRPQAALLSNRSGFERYFVDTGTWRNVVFSSGTGDFSNAKALTYVVVYASGEDPNGGREKQESFDYWSGYTKRW